MPRKDLSHIDASDRASLELEYIIKDRKASSSKQEKRVSVEQAIADKQLYKFNDNRNVTRVLFVSQDVELLNPTQQTLDGYLDISDLFAEVHLLVLRPGIPSSKPVLRAASNVWIYTATAKIWWQTPTAGINLANEQLEFAKGFRPDLIVARDPFESALVAKSLAKKYHKPSQLHILEDYSSPEFTQKDKRNVWRKWLLYFTLDYFDSIRTSTTKVKDLVAKRVSAPDIQELPQFNNYESLITTETDLELKDRYKPFIFFMLYVGPLDDVSDAFVALDAARSFLKNPRLGIIFLGKGKQKDQIMKRAKVLGVDKQVIIESREVDTTSYLKSANILLVPQDSPVSDEVVLQGAAAGIPMVMSTTERRVDIFTEGEDAFLCQKSPQSFQARIYELLNNVGLRSQFIQNSQSIIQEKFHTDPREYQTAYRESIEQALFLDEEES
jgi:glycosyltransferase involved in cell wall biosynthesis